MSSLSSETGEIPKLRPKQIKPEDRGMAKTIKKSLLLLANHQGTLYLLILHLFSFKRSHLGDAVAFCSGIVLAPESHLL